MNRLEQLLTEAIESGFEVLNIDGPSDRSATGETVARFGHRAVPRSGESVEKPIPTAEFAAITSAVMQLINIEQSSQEPVETTLIAGPTGLAEIGRPRQESVHGSFVFEGVPVAASYMVPYSGGISWSFWLGFASSAALTKWFEQYSKIMVEFSSRNAADRSDPRENEKRKRILLCDAAKHVVLSDFDLDAWAHANNLPLRTRAEVEARNAAYDEARARENPVIETPRGVPVATAADIFAGCVVRIATDDKLRIVTGISAAGVMVSESGRILDAVVIDPNAVTHIVFPLPGYKPRAARSGRERIAPVLDLALAVETTWKDGRAIYDMERALYDDHKFGPEST